MSQRWMERRLPRSLRGLALALAVSLFLVGGVVGHTSAAPDFAPSASEPFAEAPAAATPTCPGGALLGPDARCDTLTIVGNTYVDFDRNGRYESHRGDVRLPHQLVRLLDAGSGVLIAQATTNKDGYYRFAGLPAGPVYRVEVAGVEHYRPTSPPYRDLDIDKFSTYWCCSARADFGFYPGSAVPTVLPPPVIGPPPEFPPPAPPCCEVPSGRQIHLPILGYEANSNVCSPLIEVQNVGAWPTKALLILWGAPGFCPPQCTGPLKVECSGLLAPGTAWHFTGAQVPDGAKSAMVFSAPALETGPGPGSVIAPGGDIFADLLCEALYREVVGDCNSFRRFKKAFNELGVWRSSTYDFDFRAYPGASLAVEVVRKCPGDTSPMVDVTSSYIGFADEQLGAYDPVYAGFSFHVPLVYADTGGYSSWLYIQNGGLECSSVELWFKAQDDCNRPTICDVMTLAPGETHQFDATTCVGPDFTGSAWVRGSQPLSIVVDIIGNDILMTYQGSPSELKYSFEGAPAFTTGSQVLYGPLTYSEYQGWDTLVQVQNLSPITNAKVKVYFLDRSGGIINTVIDWICPNGSQGFFLPVVSEMPGNWVGAVRAESQDWIAPGTPGVAAPNIAGVVTLVKYADATRTAPLEGIAYTLLPEQMAYDWQVGAGWGGLDSGVGRIGIPSLMKDRDRSGLTTEIAINNVVPVPGFTDFIIYIYDQNGLVDSLCEKLNEKQVEYLDVEAGLAFLPRGFKGSAVISAVYWEHIFHGDGFPRNVLGLAAVKVERSGTTFGIDVPGDESAGNIGFPIIGRFAFAGPRIECPGVPLRPPPCCGPGAPGGPGGPGGPTPIPPTPTPPPGGPPPPPGPPLPLIGSQ